MRVRLSSRLYDLCLESQKNGGKLLKSVGFNQQVGKEITAVYQIAKMHLLNRKKKNYLDFQKCHFILFLQIVIE